MSHITLHFEKKEHHYISNILVFPRFQLGKPVRKKIHCMLFVSENIQVNLLAHLLILHGWQRVYELVNNTYVLFIEEICEYE